APTAETSARSPAGVALGASPSPVRWSSTTGSGGAERAGQLDAGRSAQNGGGSLLSSPVCQYVSALDRGGRAAQGSVCRCRFTRSCGCVCGIGSSDAAGSSGGCGPSGGPCTSDGLLPWGGGG